MSLTLMLWTPTRLLLLHLLLPGGRKGRSTGRNLAGGGAVGQVQPPAARPLPSLTAFRVSPPAHQKQNTGGGSPGEAPGPQLPLEEQTDAGLPGSRR